MFFVKENSWRETNPNGEAAAITSINNSSVRDESCSPYCSNVQGPLKKRPYCGRFLPVARQVCSREKSLS